MLFYFVFNLSVVCVTTHLWMHAWKSALTTKQSHVAGKAGFANKHVNLRSTRMGKKSCQDSLDLCQAKWRCMLLFPGCQCTYIVEHEPDLCRRLSEWPPYTNAIHKIVGFADSKHDLKPKWINEIVELFLIRLWHFMTGIMWIWWLRLIHLQNEKFWYFVDHDLVSATTVE